MQCGRNSPTEKSVIIILMVLSMIVELAFFASLDVRRWHDCTGEDWLILSRFNRGGNLWTEGQKGRNKFGDPPKPGVDFKGLFGFSSKHGSN